MWIIILVSIHNLQLYHKMTKEEFLLTMSIEINGKFARYVGGEEFEKEVHTTFLFNDEAHFFLMKDGTFTIPIFNKEHKAETFFSAYDILWNEFVKPEWFS